MDTNLTQSGGFLQVARKRKGLSLRAVEEATGISNAYLSQVEKGKIKQPSPVILHKLSNIYHVSYADLLELFGYPIPNITKKADQVSGFASRIGPITKDEEESLTEYLEFLRSRDKR